MGKILKKFPRSIVRQDTKTCRGDRRRTISRAERASSLQQLFTCMLLFAAVATFLGISLASLLAFLLPDPPPPPGLRPPRPPAPAGPGGPPGHFPALPAPPAEPNNPAPRRGGGEDGAAAGAQDAGDGEPDAYAAEDLEELFRAAAEDDM